MAIDIEPADGLLKHPNAIGEDPQHPLLDRSEDGEVDDGHGMLLSDAIEAPNPLLDPHGVPG